MASTDKIGPLSEQEISAVLSAFEKRFADNDKFVAIEFRPPGEGDKDVAGIIGITVTERYAAPKETVFNLTVRDIPLKFVVEVDIGPAPQLLLSGQAHLPVPPYGTIHGGDPIWHPNNGWGSIAFSCPELTLVDHKKTQRVMKNAVVSCNHILALIDGATVGDPISTYRDMKPGTLSYFWPVTDPGVLPIDLAFSEVPDLINHAPMEIRGLGPVKRIGSIAPGQRVFKCGARTSITTAIDDGIAGIKIAEYNNRFVYVRKTTTDFADVGDSGSAVLNKKRELVGFVIAGKATPAGIVTYYLPAFEIGAGGGSTLFVEMKF